MAPIPTPLRNTVEHFFYLGQPPYAQLLPTRTIASGYVVMYYCTNEEYESVKYLPVEFYYKNKYYHFANSALEVKVVGIDPMKAGKTFIEMLISARRRNRDVAWVGASRVGGKDPRYETT